MEKGQIVKTVDLTDGGCNACSTLKSVSHTLVINEQELLLDDLRVASLVMAVALHKGWQQEFVMGMTDEYTLYQKDELKVKLIEEYGHLTYSANGITIETQDVIADEPMLYKQVNQILTELFQLTAIEFSS